MIDLDELRRLLAAATPGPYIRCTCGKCSLVWGADQETLVHSMAGNDDVPSPPMPACIANADLFAALRNAAPALLDEVERLRAAVSALRAEAMTVPVGRHAITCPRCDGDGLVPLAMELENWLATCKRIVGRKQPLTPRAVFDVLGPHRPGMVVGAAHNALRTLAAHGFLRLVSRRPVTYAVEPSAWDILRGQR